jgi:hypothetical protein
MPSEISLVKGRGYYYFNGGDTSSWRSSSVLVPHIDMLTLEQWKNAYDELVETQHDKARFGREREAVPRIKQTGVGSKYRYKLVYPNGYTKYVRYPEQLPKEVSNPIDKQRMEKKTEMGLIASELLKVAREVIDSCQDLT